MGMSWGGGIQRGKKGQGGLLIMLLWWHDSQWLPYMVRLNLGEWGVYTDTDGSLCKLLLLLLLWE